jgi:hypothetical protein
LSERHVLGDNNDALPGPQHFGNRCHFPLPVPSNVHRQGRSRFLALVGAAISRQYQGRSVPGSMSTLSNIRKTHGRRIRQLLSTSAVAEKVDAAVAQMLTNGWPPITKVGASETVARSGSFSKLQLVGAVGEIDP